LVPAPPSRLFSFPVGHRGFNKGRRLGGSVLALRGCDASQFFDAAFEQGVLLVQGRILSSQNREIVLQKGNLLAQRVALDLEKVSMPLIHPCNSAWVAVHGD